MARERDHLERYRAKRDFDRTREPPGRRARRRGRGEPRFVIQKHAASSLHYDFRLEVGGVLKSWAVPKGPSTDPREKRLAVEVEDHPLDYADFEGVIGRRLRRRRRSSSGTAGPTATSTEGAGRGGARATGTCPFWLEGEKLRGGWTLQRTRGGAKPQWLLIKRRDEGADARRNPVSHRARVGAQRPDRRGDRGRRGRSDRGRSLRRSSAEERALLRPAPLPERVEPMKAVLTDERFSDPAGSTSASSTASAAWRSAASAGCGCCRATT